MAKSFLGEFEQMVLLAILQQGAQAFGLEVRREIERSANRKVSRGAFYTTLDRMERKGYVTWSEEDPEDPARSAPVRLFAVTSTGLGALRASHRALRKLGRGLDELLEES
jgi:PadR family transcriptional regulator PadR